MSQAQHITTTSVTGLRALGTPGQRSYELIVHTLTQRFGPAHAALFAEPVVPDVGDQVNWYTPVAGPLLALKNLRAAEKQTAEERLAVLMDDISGFAGSLRETRAADEQRLGEAVENALRFPGEDSVFVVRTSDPNQPFQPVLVDWATQADTRGVVTDRPLIGWAPRRPMPATPPVADMPAQVSRLSGTITAVAVPTHTGKPDRWVWLVSLLWLILALLTAAVLYLVLPACGLSGFARLNSCPVNVTQSALVQDHDRERAMLENRIALAERRLAEADSACTPLPPVNAQPAPVPAEDPVEPAPAQVDEIDERLEREAATAGDADVALIWNSQADLDLHVTCPAGDTIYYGNPQSARCRGRIDVDMNSRSNSLSITPIEHIYFTEPQAGEYLIKVVIFNPSSFTQPQNFRIRLTFGDNTQEFTGSVHSGSREWSTTYVYAP